MGITSDKAGPVVEVVVHDHSLVPKVQCGMDTRTAQ